MADIKVLPKQLAELIAAGEVVERPSSVIKELVENSIDAGADKITVEIKRGGILYIRITDNGCGIPHNQVRTAFLRHATSKIDSKDDLFKIYTLGFRGEALASIAAVARVEILTKTKEEPTGTRYVIEGGEEISFEETGCPDGTTIIVRDIFYNTPARMKFLKKDSSESSAVSSVVDAIALSHPEIAIKLIRDSKTTLATPGDGKIESAAYLVLGREFTSSMLLVNSSTNGIKVSGLTSKPISCRASRSAQYFFLNNRFIRSGVIAKALDQAYKNSVMIGKFPACVLNIELPFDRVDVNVHPAKTEVRFSDERAVFEAVYYAVKNAIIKGDTRPEIELKTKTAAKPNTAFQRMSTEQFKTKYSDNSEKTIAEALYQNVKVKPSFSDFKSPINSGEQIKVSFTEKSEPQRSESEKSDTFVVNPFAPIPEITPKKLIKDYEKAAEEALESRLVEEEEAQFTLIGEAFKTYIIVQKEQSIFFIDKHAAHERIVYERLKKEKKLDSQLLLSPVAVPLVREERSALLENASKLEEIGFQVEEFGNTAVIVRAVPSVLAESDILFAVSEIAENLVTKGVAETRLLDNIYHTVACRSAIKGGNTQSETELRELAKQVLSNKDIMYCPHGRPVAYELKKSEIEKQFGRLG
ncbi:MAG: DNA mismatch repair endonuclease MutL [Clostridia bacterium]|nr:DNA mismatch repair endonuclease MutL [Clostridia bacterium]